jgi:transglutaminase superfamily protein
VPPYTGYSRFTDPGAQAALLRDLPEDAMALAEIAERQTIHHNLMGWFGLDLETTRRMRRVWPPRMPAMLDALQEMPPGNLSETREPKDRIVGACMLEAHFLAGLLRAKGIPARIRAGYFQSIRDNGEHIVRFWRGALRARAADNELLRTDPARWEVELDALSRHNNEVDHHIEHWICEVPDRAGDWLPLDANRSFLKAHSDLDVGFRLPPEHFEKAWEAWELMRAADDYDPDRHAEEPQDGRSHIRSQLLSDFASLLNHDLAGMDEPDTETAAFVRGQSYEETTDPELTDLDDLAMLMETDPTIDQLVGFYRQHERLRMPGAEADPFSFVSSA